MKISRRGLDLIYEFEGKLKRMEDGRYRAYLCPAGVWTIYAGCTEGVSEGMIVTEAEGEEMFRREIAKFERAVSLACTREPNQNQFDAFVSLAYNIGEAGFRRSSVLRFFNGSRDEKAADAFRLWNKSGGRVLRGLVRRRAAEAGLFLCPIEAPPMPQKVDESIDVDKASKVTAGTVGGGIGINMLAGDPVGMTGAAVALRGNMGALLSGVDLAMWSVPLMAGTAAIAYLIWARR